MMGVRNIMTKHWCFSTGLILAGMPLRNYIFNAAFGYHRCHQDAGLKVTPAPIGWKPATGLRA